MCCVVESSPPDLLIVVLSFVLGDSHWLFDDCPKEVAFEEAIITNISDLTTL